MSQAFDISGNGAVAIGSSWITSNSHEAFRWTSAGGMIGLGDLPGGDVQSGASGASFDGNVIVGFSSSGLGVSPEAFRWTPSTGMIGLGELPGGQVRSTAEGVSGDGLTVVGRSASAGGEEAFRWTPATGMVGLGDLPGGGYGSSALAASHSGEVIVGFGTVAAGVRAFRWTQAAGMVGLGAAGAPGDSIALGVSGSGEVAVGTYLNRASVWDSSGAMSLLTPLVNVNSNARDASFDGRVIVGDTLIQPVPLATIWIDNMPHSVSALLSGFGVNLSNWLLMSAQSVSDDGLTIAGYGLHNGVFEGWVATIPAPGSIGALALGVVLIRRRR